VNFWKIIFWGDKKPFNRKLRPSIMQKRSLSLEYLVILFKFLTDIDGVILLQAIRVDPESQGTLLLVDPAMVMDEAPAK
jgi:hypothetical protein